MLEFLAGVLIGAAAVLLLYACAAYKEHRDVERYKQDYIYPGAPRHSGTRKEVIGRFVSLEKRGPLHR